MVTPDRTPRNLDRAPARAAICLLDGVSDAVTEAAATMSVCRRRCPLHPEPAITLPRRQSHGATSTVRERDRPMEAEEAPAERRHLPHELGRRSGAFPDRHPRLRRGFVLRGPGEAMSTGGHAGDERRERISFQPADQGTSQEWRLRRDADVAPTPGASRPATHPLDAMADTAEPGRYGPWD